LAFFSISETRPLIPENLLLKIAAKPLQMETWLAHDQTAIIRCYSAHIKRFILKVTTGKQSK